ncbi:MAG: CHAD domain-containing protein [Thermodesulfobacteriota bacterium]
MKTSRICYRLSDHGCVDRILKRLAKRFLLKQKNEVTRTIEYLDSFDWRLFGKGVVCYRQGGRYSVVDLAGEKEVVFHGSQKKYPAMADFSDPDSYPVLKALGPIRSLMGLGMMRRSRLECDLLNRDRKTVARMVIRRDFGIEDKKSPDFGGMLLVEAVRGYEKDFSRVEKILLASGLGKDFTEDNPLRRLLASRNKKVLSYSSKLSFTFDNDINLPKAAQSIFLHLLEAVRINHPWVIADIDTEFLHDFRVALRRSRSLLSSLKKLLRPEVYIHGQEMLKEITSHTGMVRDLDVYMLEKYRYLSMLPGELHGGLEEFYLDLARLRKDQFLKMKRWLQGERYQELVDDWQRLLKNDLTTSFKKKGRGGCRQLACKAIEKRFSRIVGDGELVTEDSPDDALHRLRIQGKKLRYLFEFYGSFFSADNEQRFLRQLKKLQNNLGTFNDISVQKEMLFNYQKQLKGRTKRSLAIAASLGGLVTALEDEHSRVRKKFSRTFSDFVCDENRKLLLDLVQTDPGRS